MTVELHYKLHSKLMSVICAVKQHWSGWTLLWVHVVLHIHEYDINLYYMCFPHELHVYWEVGCWLYSCTSSWLTSAAYVVWRPHMFYCWTSPVSRLSNWLLLFLQWQTHQVMFAVLYQINDSLTENKSTPASVSYEADRRNRSATNMYKSNAEPTSMSLPLIL